MNALPNEYVRRTSWRLLLRILPAIGVGVLWFYGQPTAAMALFATVFCTIGYLTLSPTTRLLGPVTTHWQGDALLLTLDDGPHPDSTPALLDLLDRHGVKAVFFVIGDRVNQWPDLAREIVRRGHTIGNHSQAHPSGRFWILGPRGTWREVAGCQQTLREITGEEPQWFRAPVGHYGAFTHPALDELGLRLMSWSCRGFDTVDPDVPRVLRRMASNVKPGAIVLLHEAIPTSVELVEGILGIARAKGLRWADPTSLQ